MWNKLPEELKTALCIYGAILGILTGLAIAVRYLIWLVGFFPA